MNDPNPVRLTDVELLEQIVARHPAALSELYDRFSKLLYGIILSVVRDTDDAEDLLQEVFVQVWRSAGTYQAELAAPKRWLVRMAHNRAIDLLRSKRYRQKKSEVRAHGEAENPIDLVPCPEENAPWSELVHHESSAHLSRALSTLPESQQSLIRMAFFDGHTHHEIATLTGIPLGTVKTRIRTGMQTLRSHLMATVGEPI